MIGANINAYFKAAMTYPVERLIEVMRGRDQSIPQAAAMMALQIKKPMVDAMKGQEAAQRPKQPSVKDQMEQEVSMLPENVGIMNLPAQNMDSVGMASGGIVAFDDGGRVPGYADGGRPVSPFGFSGMGGGYSGPYSPRELEQMRKNAAEAEEARRLQREATIAEIRNKQANNIPLTPAEQALLSRVPAISADAAKEPPVSDVYPSEGMRGSATFTRPGAQSPQAGAQATPFIDARAGSREGAVPSGGGRGAAPVVGGRTPAFAIPAYTPSKEGELTAELEKIRRVMPDVGKEYDALGREVGKTYTELEAERERTRPQGRAMEGLEKLLAKEEGEAKGKESKNLNMALLNAGLAIAGGKSQYALQNIAEGAQVGTKQYMAGLEKLEEAAKERRRQAAAIEEARRAEARGDWKDANQFKREAADARLGVQKAKIEGVSKITGESVKVAQDIVNNQNVLAQRDRAVQYQGAIEREKALLQHKADMARTGVLGEGNLVQKQLLAQQRGEEGFKTWLANNKISALDMQTKDPQLYFQYRDWFMRKAYEGAGLPYTGGGAGQGAPKLSTEEMDALKLYTEKQS